MMVTVHTSLVADLTFITVEDADLPYVPIYFIRLNCAKLRLASTLYFR